MTTQLSVSSRGWRLLSLVAIIGALAISSNASVDAAPRISQGTDYEFLLDTNGDPFEWPITVRNSEFYIHQDVIDDGFEGAVLRAIQTWELHPESNISFRYMGPTNVISELSETAFIADDGRNVVSYKQLVSGTRLGIAGFSTSGEVIGGNIVWEVNWDVSLNLAQRNNFGNGSGNTYDMEALVLHEMGHVLGLDHPTNPDNAVMYQNLLRGDKGRRFLRAGDKVGISILHPDSAPNCAGKKATIEVPPTQNANPGLAIVGTGAADVIVGGKFADTINGKGGSDTICGLAGSDRLVGSGGADKLVGGGGADQLLGGKGNDVLEGKAGPDSLLGGPGNDVLRGGAGSDACNGNAGNDSKTSC